ncbi:MAG TPA: PEP-CTERM system TPR-repeat protein PrsT, partial [Candidatus Competibacteraceae bacterium]|nr:PEP-CTERM system TPR-repeat protein PrsT [Candidatus Competibacteraceae bacterium]
ALTQARTQDFKGAADSIQRALAVQGDYLPSRVAQVELLAQQQKFKEALTAARALQSQFPKLSVGYQLEGNLYLRQKDFAKALSAYRTAHARAADSQTVLLLAGAQQVTGDGEGALKTLRDWLAVQPGDVQVRTRLAMELQRLGRREEAIAEYERLARREGADSANSAAVTLDRGVQQADTLLIQAYLQQKEYDKAIAAARELTEKRPDDPVAFNLLGAAWLARDDVAASRKAFEQALRLKPDYVPAQMNLAGLDLKAGDRVAAQLRYRQLLERNPDNLAALLRLAELLGHGDESLSLLEKAWARQPDSIEAGLALGQEYVAGKDNRRAMEVVNKLLARYPENPQVLRALGLLQVNEGKSPAAVATFERLAALQPRTPEPWYMVAMAQATAPNVPAALTALDKALAVRGNYLPALLARARLQAREGRFADALAGARQIQTLYPEQITGHMLEGDLQLQQKAFTPAVAAYQAAHAKAPDTTTTVRLANAQWLSGAREPALTTLRQWLASEPNDSRVRLQLALYLQDSNKGAAIAEYERLAEKFPDDGVVLNNLAWFYFEAGDPRAQRTAERAYDKAPKNPEVADTLGWILVQSDDAARGAELLRKAVELSPQQPTIRYHLAVAYAKLGRKDAARQELEKLADAPEPFPEREEARKLLASLGKS